MRPHRLRLPPSPASGSASGAACDSASAACAGGGAAAGIAACGQVAEMLLGELLQLVLLELLHGWEGHGGVERKRNLGALTSCKRGRGPPWPQRTWSALD